MIAPAGMVTLVNRSPVKLVLAEAAVPSQLVASPAVRTLAASLTSSAPATTWKVTVTVTGPASSLVMVPTPCASTMAAPPAR